MGILFFLLSQVVLTYDPPNPEENVTGYQLEQSDKSGDYSNAIVTDIGNPDVVNGKKEYHLMIDRAVPKYFQLRAKNSFGMSEPSNEVRSGPPSGFTSLAVMPN